MTAECFATDHGAPWNEGEDGECDCSHCRRRRRKEAADERKIEEAYDD